MVERDGKLFWETRGDYIPAGGLSWNDMERGSEFSRAMRDDDDYVLYIVRVFLRALGEYGNVTLAGNGVKMRGMTNKGKKYCVSIAFGKTKLQLKASAGDAYIADFLKSEQDRVYDAATWSMRRKVGKTWEIVQGFEVKPFVEWQQPSRRTNQPPPRGQG